MKYYVADIGGSHITCAIAEVGDGHARVIERTSKQVDSHATADEILVDAIIETKRVFSNGPGSVIQVPTRVSHWEFGWESRICWSFVRIRSNWFK